MNNENGTNNENRTDSTSLDSPIDSADFAWPEVVLDPVSKMRAVAAGLPYCAVRETVLDAPFDRAWNFIVDFENSTAKIEGVVTRVEILERRGETLRLRSRMLPGYWMEANVILRPGWCLMNSRMGQIGMAARPEGSDQTRFIHFEGSQVFGRVLRPYFHWSIGGDFRRLKTLLG